MRYVSTRGDGGEKSFSEILLEGIAPDGGLYVPVEYPTADVSAWRSLTYPQLAARVLALFAPERNWNDITARTYTAEKFGSADIAPLSELEGGRHLLHLSNGPTLRSKT